MFSSFFQFLNRVCDVISYEVTDVVNARAGAIKFESTTSPRMIFTSANGQDTDCWNDTGYSDVETCVVYALACMHPAAVR